jgi:hypothetical protein
MESLDDITAIVRTEVARHVFADFANTDDFQRDLHILSDDLTSIAIFLQDRFGVKLSRSEYRQITNVLTFAEALHKKLTAVGRRGGE